MKRRLALGVLALASITACSPAQTRVWLRWHRHDPEAAEAWAKNECGDLCTLDWDQDGLVEPEPSATSADETPSDDSATSTETSESDESDTPAPDYSGGSTVWDSLAQCESGGNWSINTGNGYYGGLQFLESTWLANGGSGYPHENSREEQIRVAENLRANAGYSPWPACSAQLGL